MNTHSIRLRFFVAIFSLSLLITACGEKSKGEPVTPSGDVFTFDLRKIGKNEVKFFYYVYKDRAIKFLVARSESGEVKTAFDACITCYPHKMGYRQEKDCVVCIFCNTAFRIGVLDQGVGNCVPIKIPHSIEGDTLRISLKEIEEGYKWF